MPDREPVRRAAVRGEPVPGAPAVAPAPAPPPAPSRMTSANATAAPPERRTVTIRGRGAERDLTWTAGRRPRPSRPVHERPGFKPDRAAMWAVLLGLLLVLIAATSSHAAVRAQSAAAARMRDGGAPAARAVAAPRAAPVRAEAVAHHRA